VGCDGGLRVDTLETSPVRRGSLVFVSVPVARRGDPLGLRPKTEHPASQRDSALRGLYAAKTAGRNRVNLAGLGNRSVHVGPVLGSVSGVQISVL
jgi:hypothetical protein